MYTLTFDSIIEKVVNNRSASRKDKLASIQRFLKENAGKKNNPSEEELAIIETLKSVRQNYLQKEKEEKLANELQKKSSY